MVRMDIEPREMVVFLIDSGLSQSKIGKEVGLHQTAIGLINSGTSCDVRLSTYRRLSILYRKVRRQVARKAVSA